MKKRMIAFFVIAVLALTMIGCGNETQEPVDAPDTITESVVPEENPVIDDVVQEPEVTVQPTDEPEADVVPEEIPTEDATTAEDTDEVPTEETVDETPTTEDTSVVEEEPAAEETIDEVTEPDTVTDAVEEEPTVEASFEDLRIEKLNYDFEGVLWLDESGAVHYFDGTYHHSYYTFDNDYDGLPDEGKVQYIATDRRFEHAGDDFGFRWWIEDENTLGYCLDGGEMGDGDGAVTEYYTAISTEKLTELFPEIGKSETQTTITQTPEVEEPTVEDTNEVADVDFEDKYWLRENGRFGHYYDGTTEYRYYTNGNVYEAPYIFANGIIDSNRDGWSVTFKPSIKDGKLYLEPTFTDGFGGETMVFEEVTKDEFYSIFEITE